MSKLLIVISGSSGVGKRCIMEGIELYSKLNLLKCPFKKIVLYNTRERREHEEDGETYHFCNKPYIGDGKSDIIKNNKQKIVTAKAKNPQKDTLIEPSEGLLFMYPVRDDLQAIDLQDIQDGVNFVEIYDKFINALQPILQQRFGIRVFRLFIAPFTENDMKQRALVTQTDHIAVITNEMRRRICERRKFGLSHENEAELVKRTDNAVKEIEEAFSKGNPYDAILVNPCGEADICWGTPNTIPTGQAKETVEMLCKIIEAQI